MCFMVFSKKGMYYPPIQGDMFRVGPYVGKALWVTRWFVVMLLKKSRRVSAYRKEWYC